MRSSTFALAPTLLLLAACGTGEGVSASVPSAPTTPESPLAFLATSGGSTFVVEVQPDTREVTAFGPALPMMSMDTAEQMTVSADGTRIVVSFINTSNLGKVVVGDGKTWTTIYSGMGAGVGLTSNDLSLFEVFSDCPAGLTGTQSSIVAVVDTRGRHLYDNVDCTFGAMTTVEGFGPGGAYFLVTPPESAVTPVHTLYNTLTGAQVSFPVYKVKELFATSVVGEGIDGEDHFVDLSGNVLNVSGYDGCDEMASASGLCAKGGSVFAIEDRSVNPVGSIPSGIAPVEIAALVVGGYVQTVADSPSGETDIVDANDHVIASFVPGPAPTPDFVVARDGGNPSAAVVAVAASSPRAPRWFVMRTGYGAFSQDDPSAYTYALRDDLWLLADAAGNIASKTIPIRKGPIDEFTFREYVPSASGAYVAFVDGDSTLHVIDVDGGEDRTVTSDFAFLNTITERLAGVGGTTD
jgi:hypothetical protein